MEGTLDYKDPFLVGTAAPLFDCRDERGETVEQLSSFYSSLPDDALEELYAGTSTSSSSTSLSSYAKFPTFLSEPTEELPFSREELENDVYSSHQHATERYEGNKTDGWTMTFEESVEQMHETCRGGISGGGDEGVTHNNNNNILRNNKNIDHNKESNNNNNNNNNRPSASRRLPLDAQGSPLKQKMINHNVKQTHTNTSAPENNENTNNANTNTEQEPEEASKPLPPRYFSAAHASPQKTRLFKRTFGGFSSPSFTFSMREQGTTPSPPSPQRGEAETQLGDSLLHADCEEGTARALRRSNSDGGASCQSREREYCTGKRRGLASPGGPGSALKDESSALSPPHTFSKSLSSTVSSPPLSRVAVSLEESSTSPLKRIKSESNVHSPSSLEGGQKHRNSERIRRGAGLKALAGGKQKQEVEQEREQQQQQQQQQQQHRQNELCNTGPQSSSAQESSWPAAPLMESDISLGAELEWLVSDSPLCSALRPQAMDLEELDRLPTGEGKQGTHPFLGRSTHELSTHNAGTTNIEIAQSDTYFHRNADEHVKGLGSHASGSSVTPVSSPTDRQKSIERSSEKYDEELMNRAMKRDLRRFAQGHHRCFVSPGKEDSRVSDFSMQQAEFGERSALGAEAEQHSGSSCSNGSESNNKNNNGNNKNNRNNSKSKLSSHDHYHHNKNNAFPTSPGNTRSNYAQRDCTEFTNDPSTMDKMFVPTFVHQWEDEGEAGGALGLSPAPKCSDASKQASGIKNPSDSWAESPPGGSGPRFSTPTRPRRQRSISSSFCISSPSTNSKAAPNLILRQSGSFANDGFASSSFAHSLPASPNASGVHPRGDRQTMHEDSGCHNNNHNDNHKNNNNKFSSRFSVPTSSTTSVQISSPFRVVRQFDASRYLSHSPPPHTHTDSDSLSAAESTTVTSASASSSSLLPTKTEEESLGATAQQSRGRGQCKAECPTKPNDNCVKDGKTQEKADPRTSAAAAAGTGGAGPAGFKLGERQRQGPGGGFSASFGVEDGARAFMSLAEINQRINSPSMDVREKAERRRKEREYARSQRRSTGGGNARGGARVPKDGHVFASTFDASSFFSSSTTTTPTSSCAPPLSSSSVSSSASSIRRKALGICMTAAEDRSLEIKSELLPPSFSRSLSDSSSHSSAQSSSSSASSSSSSFSAMCLSDSSSSSSSSFSSSFSFSPPPSSSFSSSLISSSTSSTSSSSSATNIATTKDINTEISPLKDIYHEASHNTVTTHKLQSAGSHIHSHMQTHTQTHNAVFKGPSKVSREVSFTPEKYKNANNRESSKPLSTLAQHSPLNNAESPENPSLALHGLDQLSHEDLENSREYTQSQSNTSATARFGSPYDYGSRTAGTSKMALFNTNPGQLTTGKAVIGATGCQKLTTGTTLRTNSQGTGLITIQQMTAATAKLADKMRRQMS